jgi:DNA repair exonuclease SbcCD nuclease subunit
MKFIHTADWQIGKPFARIADAHKRTLVQQARLEAIKRIGAAAREGGADFALVAGDLFDSASADKATVSATCSAIGLIGLPVLVIPGNHDHAGPGSVWEQEFFKREQAALAPKLVILTEARPYELETAVVLPCPLLRRAVVGDPTEWLRVTSVYESLPAGKARIVLAHGSTQAFVSGDEEEDGSAANLLDLGRLPGGEIDYIALGDWHGTKQVGSKAWYPGTPEPDHFAKGGDYESGNVLLVDARRGEAPQVTKVPAGRLKWSELAFDLADDSALAELENRLAAVLGQRANEDLLRLTVTGSLGMEAMRRLEQMRETLEARLLRLKLVDSTIVAPTTAEIEALTASGGDPLVARVASRLVEEALGGGEQAAVARVALRELYAACVRERSG